MSALCFALAQLAKYTAAYLVPILILIALGHAAPALGALARRGTGAGWPGGWAGRGRTRRSTSRPSWWS